MKKVKCYQESGIRQHMARDVVGIGKENDIQASEDRSLGRGSPVKKERVRGIRTSPGPPFQTLR